MLELVVAGALFLGTHLGISSTGLRGALVRSLGERAYLGLYSLIAVATLAYLILIYATMPQARFLWAPGPAHYWVAIFAMPVAMILLVGGFMTRNPTAVGQEAALEATDTGRGVIRITRHPFQWAVVIWAAAHIVANGDLASVVFFGVLGMVSLAGTALMDRKKAAQLGGEWGRFAGATSNVPLAAILRGRNAVMLRELWAPLLVGLVLYGLVFWGHPWVAGVPVPLP